MWVDNGIVFLVTKFHTVMDVEKLLGGGQEWTKRTRAMWKKSGGNNVRFMSKFQ